MRFLLIFSFIFVNLFANSSEDFYQKALEFEKMGDYKNASVYYKKAFLSKNQKAQNVLETKLKNEDIKIENNENSIKISSPKKINRNKKDFSDKKEDIFSQADFVITPYKANYILPISYVKHAGDDFKNPETKFQISLKKEIFHDIFKSRLDLYFGYTQRSWWQIAKDSSPFRETNYMPEFFILRDFKNLNNFRLSQAKLGLLHQSNGQGGIKSRSWNRIYLEGLFDFGNFEISPRIWYRIKERASDDDNPDISNYAGRGDIDLKYAFSKQIINLKITNNLRFDEKNRGNFELGWYFPTMFSKLYGYIQYFNGYAESLIDYDKSTQRIGAGFVLYD